MSSLRPREYPRRQPSFSMSSAQLAMYIGLASLTVVFGATLVAYFITRVQAKTWSEEAPDLPGGLVVSTATLVLLSFALHYAQRLLDRNNRTGLLRGLGVALALALTFLLAQIQNWRSLSTALAGVEIKSLYVFSFYFLTGLHALHVLLGIFPLIWVYSRARKDNYSSSRTEGVHLLRQYWDFLLIVWVVLLLALWL